MSKINNEEPHIISVGSIELDRQKPLSAPELNSLPILPTKNLVLFPKVTIPLTIVREESLRLLKDAEENRYLIGVCCQLDPEVKEPTYTDISSVGVTAEVLKVITLPDGTNTAILRSFEKFLVDGPGDPTLAPIDNYEPIAAVTMMHESVPRKNDKKFQTAVERIKNITLTLLEDIDGAQDFSHNLRQIPDGVSLINLVATQLPVSSEIKTELLLTDNLRLRAESLEDLLRDQQEIDVYNRTLKERAKARFEGQHRQAFLQNQMEVIKQELYGDSDDEIDELRQKAIAMQLPDNIMSTFDKEINKLSRLNPQSPEYNVQYSFLETLLDLPWNKHAQMSTDFKAASATLEHDHYGLEKVKERIIEQLAAMWHNPEGKMPILCLVGPPGVGKTSIGQSIADALKLPFQRVSLGGLHDEAEIRGHRRTYIGAMPGRIIEAMRRAGVSNPVILLDEVDKIGADFKGDPSAAMLEVLDPEQNCRFHDNYIDVDYDLSNVLFIATANTLSTLSQPLLDRMEIIEIPGYLIEEKVEIAKRHLIPRLRKQYRLSAREFSVADAAIADIVERYTAESGVRQLNKELAKIARKRVLEIVKDSKDKFQKVTPTNLPQYLGIARFSRDRYEGNDFAGVVTGLAWTAVGGEILFIEASLSKGTGDKLTLTGNLGNVMKESAAIALQWVHSHAASLNIDEKLFEQYRLHLHVPEGAIPKDGPSAGITMATAIASAFTRRKVLPRMAMTGEITLRGKVLPVGGIKEKILAAKRAGINTIILSEQNQKDIADIEPRYIEGLTFHYVSTVDQVISLALLDEYADNLLAAN